MPATSLVEFKQEARRDTAQVLARQITSMHDIVRNLFETLDSLTDEALVAYTDADEDLENVSDDQVRDLGLVYNEIQAIRDNTRKTLLSLD